MICVKAVVAADLKDLRIVGLKQSGQCVQIDLARRYWGNISHVFYLQTVLTDCRLMGLSATPPRSADSDV